MPTTSASVRAGARPSGVVTSASTVARSAVASWAEQDGQRADQLAELRRRRPDVPEPGDVLHDGMGRDNNGRHAPLLEPKYGPREPYLPVSTADMLPERHRLGRMVAEFRVRSLGPLGFPPFSFCSTLAPNRPQRHSRIVTPSPEVFCSWMFSSRCLPADRVGTRP